MSPLALAAVLCTTFAVILLVWYLVRRPPLDMLTKVLLLLGLGIFPIGAAGSANIEGYKATQQRHFCGSCHVMEPHANDSNDRTSLGLASRHARNPSFGNENCYTCHADYGMYGTVLTKMGGMRHVWLYYTEFRTMPLPEAREKIHLIKPFSNQNCRQCHSTTVPGWLATPDHRSSLDDVLAERISCASAGCHGYAHPTTKNGPATVPAQLLRALDAGVIDGAAR